MTWLSNWNAQDCAGRVTYIWDIMPVRVTKQTCRDDIKYSPSVRRCWIVGFSTMSQVVLESVTGTVVGSYHCVIKEEELCLHRRRARQRLH